VRKRQTKLVWSARALNDVRRIGEYIRRDNPGAARRLAQQIKSAARRLTQFPLSGRTLPEFPDASYREVIVRNYRIIYEPVGGDIEILTVVHGMRDLPSLLPCRET
jgi:toxin ParE1/3/4